MSNLVMDTLELKNRAVLIKKYGESLRYQSNRLLTHANSFKVAFPDIVHELNIQAAANRLNGFGNWLINLAGAIDMIATDTINNDKVNAQFIRETFSDLDTVDSFISKGGNLQISQFSKSEGNYWERSWDYAIKGDYSSEFTLLGMAGNVGIGMIPYVGQAADIRDFSYAVSHTHEHSFLGNVGLISLAVIAFVPLFGDIAKNLKYIKYADEVGDVVKQVDNVDDAIKGFARNGDRIINSVTDLPKEVLESKPLYSPDPIKWIDADKSVKIDIDGNWVYKNLDGLEVKYINNEADFKGAGVVIQEVNVGEFTNNYEDFKKANELAPNGPKSPGNTWHHLQDGQTLQEIDSDIHDEFRHIGKAANNN